MKIALLGYGKMGKMVESLALQENHLIVAKNTSIQKQNLSSCDICISFSHPKAALDDIRLAADYKKNIVIGTTGWYDKLEEVGAIVEKNEIGLLYSPNFSIGLAIFLHALDAASKKLAELQEYDVAGWECHHKHKVDAPSATALQIQKMLEKNMHKAVAFQSTRSGSFPGTHTVFFDSPCDTLTFTHCARSREGFAKGALLAAKWLIGKKGVFTLSDIL